VGQGVRPFVPPKKTSDPYGYELDKEGRYSMRKILSFILIFMILIPTIGVAARPHVMENRDLDELMTRKELATVGVRLKEVENLLEFYDDKDIFSDVKGWAKPYINLAYTFDIMKGTGKDKFEPDANVSYVELLTVIMRSLGYHDGIDFVKYPEDYYNKALEIGLANMYMPHDQLVTRQIAYDSLMNVFDMEDKYTHEDVPEDYQINDDSYGEAGLSINAYKEESSYYLKEWFPKEMLYIELNFSTSIIGMFSGKLGGIEDFTGYKIELLSKNDELYDSRILGKDGEFSFTDFDISPLAKLKGYKYKIYDDQGEFIWSGNLE